MSLKDYQQRIVREVHTYLRHLAEVPPELGQYAAQEAWKRAGVPGPYTPEENGLGEDLPRLCIKVPTGGGKTLLATQMLGSAMQTVLADRNGAGLVLWVVPSSQIYRDTIKALRERGGFLRTMLEHAVSRKVELWEKTDVVRMTPSQLRTCLNILVVQLASTNRETKDQLKFFKDSGGNITMHFPPEDEPEAHAKLKAAIPNLEMIEDDADRNRHLAKTSVGNLVKLCRPAVILDEGHKATSELAQRTLRDFNASIIFELSATPRKGANIISRANGQELLDEEMIKLPMNIAVSGAKNWKDLLTRARDKRENLGQQANSLVERGEAERPIRPIVLVQVERTGKDQRDGKHIHSEQVREHLVQKLGVPANAVAIKSTATDDLEKIDLMDEGCPITWIITKAALQEGWDCPFAYILVSLDNTGSERAMTQLIGRVLRQPFQERTKAPDLNQCYVYCLRASAAAVSKQVKKALEQEGYEGDLEAAVNASGEGTDAQSRVVRIRSAFTELYRKPFEGKVYLPHFCVREGKHVEPLDYFRHLIAKVDVDDFRYKQVSGWSMSEALADAKDRFYSVTLGGELEKRQDTQADLLEDDSQVLAWVAAGLPFDYLSFKQIRRIVRAAYDELCGSHLDLRGQFALVKFAVREKLEKFITDEVNRQTEAAFAELFEADRVCFYLECKECRFEVPDSIELRHVSRMTRENGDDLQRSLFDYVADETQNEYERSVALCLDRDERILWWYRNLVGAEHFAIQGPRRERVRPDFVVKRDDTHGHEIHDVLVLESKGEHLRGNRDTEYKRMVAAYFEKAGRRVSWQQLGEEFKDHQFRFQVLDEADELGHDWKELLESMLTG